MGLEEAVTCNSSSDSSEMSDCRVVCSDCALIEGLEAVLDSGSTDGYNSDSSQSRDVVDHEEFSERLDVGRMQHGCTHYRRRCRIRAPCCNEIFDCRHCHNEVKNTLNTSPQQQHDLPRHEIEKVICSLCSTEQEVRQICKNCGVRLGEYFCGSCKLWDDDTSKEQYHCDGCGICRIGGSANFFHCRRCGCCYSVMLRGKHPCVERAMHHNCPVCFEFLFESTKNISVLPCGHTIHTECLKEMQLHFQFSCPVCSKSICDMSKVWERLDQEVASTSIPETYHNKMVWILCNDCGANSEVHYHILAHKCLNCNSYNTRQIRGGASTHNCTTRVG